MAYSNLLLKASLEAMGGSFNKLEHVELVGSLSCASSPWPATDIEIVKVGLRYANPSKGGRPQDVTNLNHWFCCSGENSSKTCNTSWHCNPHLCIYREYWYVINFWQAKTWPDLTSLSNAQTGCLRGCTLGKIALILCTCAPYNSHLQCCLCLSFLQYVLKNILLLYLLIVQWAGRWYAMRACHSQYSDTLYSSCLCLKNPVFFATR